VYLWQQPHRGIPYLIRQAASIIFFEHADGYSPSPSAYALKVFDACWGGS
jgi:hypothetical protein